MRTDVRKSLYKNSLLKRLYWPPNPPILGGVWWALLAVLALLIAAPSTRADDILLKNGTVLTVTKGTIKNGEVLIHDGKIAAVGRNLRAPAGARVIDETGRYIMPGIVDAHSHMCIEGGVNEAAEVVSAEVDINDVINNKDNGIKWALAGGVTSINAMHGSANPIGGLTATLKMRWGKSAEEMKFAGARRSIKFALGENPKRVHADDGVASRLGVADTLRQEFVAAREYQRDWDDYNRKKLAGLPAVPPHKDLKLESLAGVLRGDIWVQCHCYRADEIEMLLKLSDEFGFHIGALHHVLEGYKVAPEIAKRNVGASTFSDFWGYKIEAYDGIDHNAAALTQWGVRTSVNSDSGERIRRLNLDAAKSLRYGRLTDDQCLALITINPAWQLDIDKRVGSLEIGKDADISIWDSHPLSVYSKCVMTLVDGQIYFERRADGSAVFGIQNGSKSMQDTRSASVASVAPAGELGVPAPSAPPPSSEASSATPGTISASATKMPSTPAIFASSFASSPLPVTAKPTGPATFAITNARIFPISGPPIERGTVLVENGRITAVGPDVVVPSGMRVIDAGGLSLYPGFINAATTLGLTEIESIDETNDLGERGSLKAQIRAADAFHTQSAYVGVARCAGITTALVSPRGTGWMGSSALMHTAGRTIEEATVVGDLAEALSLGGGGFGGFGEGGMPGRGNAPSADFGEQRSQLEKALDNARDYGKQWDTYKRSADPSVRPPKTDLTLGALVPVTRRERPVLISANQPGDIEQAVKFGTDHLVRVIVTGGSEADRAAATLNKHGVPVIFTGVLNMPSGNGDYDKFYSEPKRLWQAGIKFCIATPNTPDVAQHAGMAAAYGLPREEALKAITLYPAQILGVDRDLGSIEPGKIADLLLTDGDPLEFRTSIKRMFVNGVDTPLVSKHTQLYEQYRKPQNEKGAPRASTIP